MRILFTSWAWPSHLHAMVPTAWACRLAGHDVLMASQPALAGTILGTGLPAASVGYDIDAVATFRDIVFARPGAPGGAGPRVLGLLSALAESMTKDLTELAVSWRADLIVFDPTAFAGPLAAASAGLPAVRHLYGTDLMSVVRSFLPRVLDPLAERFGLAPVDPFGLATVDPYPAGLQVDVASRRLPVRSLSFNGSGRLPAGLPAPRPGRPRVCVTWGNTLARIDPELFLAGPVLRAIAGRTGSTGMDVELVVAIAPEQRAMLGPVPAGVQVVESAPLNLVLPGCAAVIAHGGAGSLLTAVSLGLPQLLIPRLPDHVRHADRLARTGAGLVVPAQAVQAAEDAEAAQAGAIADGLTRLLAEPEHRLAAARLSAELAGQPSPAQLVTQLEAIVAQSKG